MGFLKKMMNQAARWAPTRLKDLSIAIVGDKKMGALHQQYMGIAGPTDVLSFALDEDERGRPTSGQLVICLPEARRQAKRRGLAVRDELLLYAIHGFLHLSGFDDRTDPDYRKMHRREDEILRRLGLSGVFEQGMSHVSTARSPSKCK